MNWVRVKQAAVLISLNLVLLLALDYTSPTPVIVKPVEEPASFTVKWNVGDITHWDIFLRYGSEEQRDSFLPIIEMLEEAKLGEYIRYETDFLEVTSEETILLEALQGAASMDVPWFIGGNSKEEVSGTQRFLNKSSMILITPYVSIDRGKITSSSILSLLPNSTEVARQYVQLLVDERLDYLIVLTSSGSDEALAAYYQQENDEVRTLSIESGQQEVLEALSQFETGTRIGVFIRQPTTECTYLNELGQYNITLYCENPATLEMTIKVFKPVSSSPILYAEFMDLYLERTGKTPSYADALLYDTCRILQNAVEIARYRAGRNPEAIWKSARRLNGVTGNCTLTAYGDRMYQKYVLETVTKGN